MAVNFANPIDFRAIAPLPAASIQGALVGDSRCANSHLLSGASLASNGIAFWVEALSRGRVRFPGTMNFGVSGDTTDNVLARMAPVIASSASFAIILVSVNDTIGSTNTLAQRQANLLSIITQTRNSGKVVILVSELPVGGGTTASFTGTKLDQHMAMAQYARYLAGSMANVFLADPWPSMVQSADATGTPISGMLADGLHQTATGAYNIAVEVCRVINTIYPELSLLLPSSAADLYSAINTTGNLIANCAMSGAGGTTGTGGSGSVATSFSLLTTEAAMTVVGSKVTAGNKTWQQLVVGGTPTGGAPFAALNQNFSAANLTAGDVIEAVCEFELDAGASGVLLPYLQIGSSNANAWSGASATATLGGAPNLSISGIMRSPRLTVPSGIASTVFRFAVPGIQNVTASATVRVGKLAVRKVPPL